MHKIRNYRHTISIVTLSVFIVLVLNILLLLNASEWTCEDAFALCVASNWLDGSEILRCAMGYNFCKKYLE
ncbi:hypothetical protein NLC29_01225 [Candidatus Aminicenantes bacterium AH-873-B07]|jgi:hypothetical protein|nr:hypothetical protein [Candidatus Aminicenantes bacterium AH-873-B07]